MRIGSQTIGSLRLGANAVDKVLLGSNLVYSLPRYFNNLDPIQNSHYVIANPITFAGDFDIALDFVTTKSTNQILIGDSHLAAYYLNIYSEGVTLWAAGQSAFFGFSSNAYQDGRLHKLIIRLIGSSVEAIIDNNSLGFKTINPYTGVNNFKIGSSNSVNTYFDGIIANVKFTDKSGATDVTTTFNLDTPTGNTEYSREGTSNAVTYINIPDINETTPLREEFTFVDGNWLGPEIVTNGSFDSDTGWDKQSNWVIAAGKATSDGIISSQYIRQSLNISQNSTYLVDLETAEYTQGQLTVILGDVIGDRITSAGRFPHLIIAGVGIFLNFQGVNNFIGSVDNVSVKRILELP